MRRKETGTRSREDQVRGAMTIRRVGSQRRRMREAIRGIKAIEGREVDQDRMMMKAGQDSGQFRIAINHGDTMNWQARAVNRLTLTNSQLLIGIRTRLQRVSKLRVNIKRIRRTNKIDVQGREEIRAREVIASELIITRIKIRIETITIATIEIRVKTTREEMAALAK